MNEPIKRKLEVLKPDLAPEEACLLALFDLEDFQEAGPGMAVGNFYAAFTGRESSEGLRTRISTSAVEQNPQDPPHFSPQKSYVPGFEIAATVIVNFDDRGAGVRGMLNLDFVRTEEGLQVMRRELYGAEAGVKPHYTQRIGEEELAALSQDALATRELIVEETAELIRLGPLEEESAEDGARRFHIGDILAVTTGRLVSPRGMAGFYDILGYMADDALSTTQLVRFADECSPVLQQRLTEAITPYSEVPNSVKDNLSLYRWLHKVTEEMEGDPFLPVGKIGEDNHAVIDPITELKLDYGPEILGKMITVDPKSPNQGNEQD